MHRILGEAGFTGVAMEPCPLSLDIAIGGGLEAAVQGALEIGPASRALEDIRRKFAPPPRNSIREALRLSPRATPCRLPASIWIVTARAS